MVKIQFTNATAEDYGYGLKVNGKDLSDIISIALGTRIGSNYGHKAGLPPFSSNCCDITVIIEPKPVTEEIETDKFQYDSVEALEEDVSEQYQKKIEQTES